MAGRTRGSGGPRRCPSCGSPLLIQLVGHFAALQACVGLPDPDQRLPYGPALAASTPDDLVWCLPRRPFGALSAPYACAGPAVATPRTARTST